MININFRENLSLDGVIYNLLASYVLNQIRLTAVCLYLLAAYFGLTVVYLHLAAVCLH